MVVESSPTATASDFNPTGPPENCSIITLNIFLSISSRPISSIPSFLRDAFATSRFILPSAFTSA